MSPTYVVDLVNASLDLLIDQESGIWHLSNTGAVTWAAFAERLADLMGLCAEFVDTVPTQMLGYIARRPRYAALASERGAVMPPLEDALIRYLQDTTLDGIDSERRRAALQVAARVGRSSAPLALQVPYRDEATYAPAEIYPPEYRQRLA